MRKHTSPSPLTAWQRLWGVMRRGARWCGGGGGAQMTGAALMQGNSPLTDGGRVEALGGSNRPPKWGGCVRCRVHRRSFSSWLPERSRVRSPHPFQMAFYFNLQSQIMRCFALREGLWLENTEQLEVVSRSQAPRLSLSEEWKGSSERLFHH